MASASTARVRFLRVAPRKASLVADLIRGKKVQEALNILSFNRRHVAKDFKKLVLSAVANAEQKGGIDPDNLWLKTVTVDRGPIYKRWRARARGSASRIEKRTSHLQVILEER
ncbi:MAG: 50S ribosomal protein L22 [Deltaproteobacteria bacterium]|nr:50S ribosomal protein L22 [Deltaproteobacteria bacterium]